MLTLLPEMLRGLSDYRMLIYAIVLIGLMLFNWSPKAIALREKYSLRRILGKTGTKNVSENRTEE